jgi:hypothetical protein
VGYFADTCETNIPYHFSVGYQRRNWLGSGYSSTVREKRFPEAAGYVLNVTGEPLPDDCVASIGLTLRVDSTDDEVDIEPGDGNCRSIASRCTLRAAVMESNAHQGHDLIEVPSGHYVLSLSGSETADVPNDAIGDLDITDGLTLMGLGRAAKNADLQVIIDGGAIDRIFDIYAAAPRAVTLSYLRLENGRPMGSGGGRSGIAATCAWTECCCAGTPSIMSWNLPAQPFQADAYATVARACSTSGRRWSHARPSNRTRPGASPGTPVASPIWARRHSCMCATA